MFALFACSPQPEERAKQPAASEARVRLLTAEQYTISIAQLFGSDIANSVIPPMPPLQRTDGLLASGASAVGLTSDQVSQVQQAARVIAAQVVDAQHREFLIPCEPVAAAAPDDACAREFLEVAGRYLFRKPVPKGRLDRLTQLAAHAAERTTDFYAGLALALEAVLISPEFLFIVDQTEIDPTDPSSERLDAWSLASRLSFFLWNSPPDQTLLAAAQTGELHDPEGLSRAIDRLLASPRLEVGMRAFFDDMLAFDDFDSLAKDPKVYPRVTAATLSDAREQTLRTIIDHLLTKNADYRDLFTTRKTFMSPHLAALYETVAGDGWSSYEFPPESYRIGLLTHVSFLAANSHAVRSSPTLRGKALRERLLCQHVPDPPPNVDFSKLEENANARTARERLRAHNENPSCAGCHLITDPMGLSLENFDGAGAYRATEDGAALDIAGELDGVFYDDVPGLATAMRNHPKLSACLVNRLYAYASGGPVELKYDRDILKGLENRFVQMDYRFPELLAAIARSEALRRVRPRTVMPMAVEAQPTANPEVAGL